MNTQLRKGVIELCILALIARQDMYGYDIVRAMEKYTDINEGTVYPILRRLTKDGYFATYLVESASGPARKYYTMTDRGRIYLKKNIEDWEEIMRPVDGKEPYIMVYQLGFSKALLRCAGALSRWGTT